ncbi:MAG: hypothetical protein R6U96_00645 [Promethearchaeia archaeon]
MDNFDKYKEEADKLLEDEFKETKEESEESKYKRDELKPPKIRITRWRKRIKYKQKKIGKFKFTDLERELLFALLGMPMDLDDLHESFKFTDEELRESFTKLEKYKLVKPVGTKKKKKSRGDSRFNIYWLLTEKGEIVAKNLLEFSNEEYKKKKDNKN